MQHSRFAYSNFQSYMSHYEVLYSYFYSYMLQSDFIF